MIQHSGNQANQIQFEEHDGELNAKRTSLVSAATIYAIVNTSAGGNVTVEQGDIPWITSQPSGVTVYQGTQPWNSLGTVTVANTINANVSLGASAQFIGIVTVANTVNANVSLSPSVAFIGHATVRIATNVNTNIGLVTIDGGRIGLTGNNTVVLGSGVGGIGFATVNIAANPNTFIGLTTTVNGAGDRFIGLVTAVTRNAGTNKTLKILPITLSTNSNSSIAISNTFYITSILLNSNATVRLSIKSGVTYLTGNASLGVNISPLSGWTEVGSVDSPIYFGLIAQDPIVIEKFDTGGIISQIGGKVVYFDE